MIYSPFEYDSQREEDDLSAAEELTLFMQLKEQESEVKDRLTLQKEKVREVLMWESGNKIENYLGFEFSIGERKSWTYSEDLQKMAADLKEFQRRERVDLTAQLSGGSVFPVMKRAKP